MEHWGLCALGRRRVLDTLHRRARATSLHSSPLERRHCTSRGSLKMRSSEDRRQGWALGF
eukprot:211356-Pleurochrysis_carterae.AAC.2